MIRAASRDTTKLTTRLSLEPFGEECYFRVTVTDDKGRRAWSNPIWL